MHTDLLKLLSTWRRKAGLRHAFRDMAVLTPPATWEEQLEHSLTEACGQLGTECHLEREVEQGAVMWRVYRLTAAHNVWSGLRRQTRHPDEAAAETSLALDVWCCCSMLAQTAATEETPSRVKLAVVLEAKQPTAVSELASWFSLWKAKLGQQFTA